MNGENDAENLEEYDCLKHGQEHSDINKTELLGLGQRKQIANTNTQDVKLLK
jgi:hypothetical protein